MPDEKRHGLKAFHDLEPALEDFGDAVISGLSAARKTLPCKFFYDQTGSQLFDRICALPEYYPTRTEIALMEAKSAEIADLVGENRHVIEFGSGSSVKIRILLDALERPAAYTAIDISRDHLLESAGSLAAERPDVPTAAVCADFTKAFTLPKMADDGAPALGFFPGSSIGNFTRPEAADFLRGSHQILSGDGAGFLIGIDLKKDPAILNAAYNDAAGVTAAFNLNLLVRANRELKANFELAAFRHHAFYNEDEGRIEMHLISLCDQQVRIGDHSFDFAADETIHTESSYKYSAEEFQDVARSAGYRPERVWIDDDRLFSLHYLLADS